MVVLRVREGTQLTICRLAPHPGFSGSSLKSYIESGCGIMHGVW